MANERKPLVIPPARKTAPAPAVNLDDSGAQHFMIHGNVAPENPIAAAAQAMPPRIVPTPPARVVPQDRPWEGKNPAIIKPYLLRLPETLHTMLEFLGETTYKESMHSIALKAVEDSVIAQMEARGISEEQIRMFLPR